MAGIQPMGLSYRARWCLGAMVLLGASCDRSPPAVRRYTQIAITSQADSVHQHAPTEPVARTLVWDTPEAWQEHPGSGMRLATFTMGAGDDQATASLIVLAGDAGGTEANIRRWLTQLSLSLGSEEEFQAFLAEQTSFTTMDEQAGILVDFTRLIEDETADATIAAVIPVGGGTAFLKLTGPRVPVQAEREQMLALCKSIRTAP